MQSTEVETVRRKDLLRLSWVNIRGLNPAKSYLLDQMAQRLESSLVGMAETNRISGGGTSGALLKMLTGAMKPKEIKERGTGVICSRNIDLRHPELDVTVRKVFKTGLKGVADAICLRVQTGSEAETHGFDYFDLVCC